MCEKYIPDVPFSEAEQKQIAERALSDISDNFNNYRMDLVCDDIWRKITTMDVIIAETEPFKLVKTEPDRAKKQLVELRKDLYLIAKMLEPMLPDTSNAICELVVANKKPTAPMFPKIELK